MTAQSLPKMSDAFRPAKAANPMELGPFMRTLVSLSCFTLSFLVLVAFARAASGAVAHLEYYRKLPVALHLIGVLPAIPLGGYLLLARKGTARHKMLGKVWIGLMFLAAISAIFIKSNGSFSLLHLFVPLTLNACWQTISTARRGDMRAHRRSVVMSYVLALVVPGIFAFAIPGRLMHTMLLG